MRGPCTVEECDKISHARGLCDKHYQRWKKWRDPTICTGIEAVPYGTTCKLDGCERPHRRQGFCRPHYERLQKYGDPLGGDVLPEYIDVDGMRWCSKCKQYRPLEEFHASRSGRKGRARTCRYCVGERTTAWYVKNRDVAPERTRISRIRRLYGEEGLKVDARRMAGEGCDVCSKVIEPMTIDHCHATGQTRGLLCKPCNFILGIAEDRPERLRALADYLEQASLRIAS